MVEPFIMRKAADNPALNLAHMGLGNKKISALAMCLPSLPLLYGLDLTGKYVSCRGARLYNNAPHEWSGTDQ